MAKKIRHGKRFEEDFIKSVPDRCDITRLKDGGGWSNATNMRFTSKNPCDFIVWSIKEYAMYKLELKSVAGRAMPFSNIKAKDEACVKFIDDLVESHVKGVKAFFVINFRSVNETFAIDAVEMKQYMETCGRKSINLEDARSHGFKINQTLKRVRWKYDLEWM